MASRRPLTRDQHRQAGVTAFNAAWELLDKKRRTPEDDVLLIHTAHASRYHWEFAGTPQNWAIGEWQISHVYAVLRRPEPALYHARRCLAICREHHVRDFPRAYAYEALARASAVAGRGPDREKYFRLAERAGRSIREEEDRAQFFRDLATISRR